MQTMVPDTEIDAGAEMSAPAPSTNRRRRLPSIDMFTPDQVCRELALDDVQLLALVNDGYLPAYDFEGRIRFRIADVATLVALLTLG